MNRVQYRSKVSRQVRGFSLLESLIGMFVAATTTLTVMGVVVAGNKVATQSNARTILTAAARRELDSILSVSQGNRRVVMNQAFTLPSSVTSQFPTQARVRATYSVESMPNTVNLQKVTVRITWRNAATQYQKDSQIAVARLIASTQDLTGGYNGTWTPGQPVYYTPPPPTPVPTTTGGGSTGGSTGGNNGGGNNGGGNNGGGNNGGGNKGGGNNGGGNNGGGNNGGNNGGTTGGQTNGGGGNPYFDPGSGNKW